jgi:hypothetical protein
MRRAAAAVALVVAVASAAGCGGSSSETKGVQPPADWAADVCGAVRSWASDQNARSRVLNRTIRGVGSFEEARERMGEYLDETIERTDTMLGDVREAGTPDVEGGAEVAREFEASLEKLRPALEDARAQADELPEDLAGFKAGVKELSDSVVAAESRVGEDLARLATSEEHPELARAFAAEPACNPQ